MDVRRLENCKTPNALKIHHCILKLLKYNVFIDFFKTLVGKSTCRFLFIMVLDNSGLVFWESRIYYNLRVNGLYGY